ncbi:MAG TPA: carboxypeptidase regulatory-like domain-containing protein, partial [Verrucomicrobiae bacterium]
GGTISFPNALFDFNLNSGAKVAALGPVPLLNNLNVAAGATLLPATTANLFIAVQSNAVINGTVTADALGYAANTGPGVGTNSANGSGGGGYGGAGGQAANGTGGGITYGSLTQPTDPGSGGGITSGPLYGSTGGGALHVSVAGSLTINGSLSAAGNAASQVRAGGGAGGSVWLNAGTVNGAGYLGAPGGNGDFWTGGGGGGGRIAVLTTNFLFTGTTNLLGGLGAQTGQTGSLYLGNLYPNLVVLTQSPTGTVYDTASAVDLTFNDAVDPFTLTATDFIFTTPQGVMNAANLTVSATSAGTVRVSFPIQNLPGNYSLQTLPPLAGLFGQPVAPFTGNFTLLPLTISGTVTDTNGQPLAGVTIQPDGVLPSTLTDTNGNYSLGVSQNWSGGLTPSMGNLIFIPGTLNVGPVTSALTNQNFIAYNSISPTVTTTSDGTNLLLNWTGLHGASYSVEYSTDLITWYPWTATITSDTNLNEQVALPIGTDPGTFYRLLVNH